jgi:alkaline phosphatase D
MIADAVRKLGGRRLMVFQHKPLYIKTPDEERSTQSALYPPHRFRLQQALAPAGRVIVCSGHIHDYKTTSWGGIDEIWAPSTAFVIDRDGLNNPVHGIRRVGYLVHTFTGTDHSHAFVEPSRFITIDLGNWMRAPETFHGLYHTEPFRGLQLAEGV